MPNYCRERLSVQTAHMFLDQAYDCMSMLQKLCGVLQFNGRVLIFKCNVKNQSKPDFGILFIKDGVCRQPTIPFTDTLRHDIYACVLVRVQEAGGIDALPETTLDKLTIDAHSKVLGDLIDWRNQDA